MASHIYTKNGYRFVAHIDGHTPAHMVKQKDAKVTHYITLPHTLRTVTTTHGKLELEFDPEFEYIADYIMSPLSETNEHAVFNALAGDDIINALEVFGAELPEYAECYNLLDRSSHDRAQVIRFKRQLNEWYDRQDKDTKFTLMMLRWTHEPTTV